MTKKFKVAVAGCGSMSQTWIEYALQREDVELVALVDVFVESAEMDITAVWMRCLQHFRKGERLKQIVQIILKV